MVTVTRARRDSVVESVAFVGSGANDSAKGEPVTLNELIAGAAASVGPGGAARRAIASATIATDTRLRIDISIPLPQVAH